MTLGYQSTASGAQKATLLHWFKATLLHRFKVALLSGSKPPSFIDGFLIYYSLMLKHFQQNDVKKPCDVHGSVSNKQMELVWACWFLKETRRSKTRMHVWIVTIDFFGMNWSSDLGWIKSAGLGVSCTWEMMGVTIAVPSKSLTYLIWVFFC